MGNTLWFINLLKEHPVAGFSIGLVFAAFMFGSKNGVVYLYSRYRAKQQTDPKNRKSGSSGG